MTPQAVLIDLDVLLDTRLAVAEQLGAEEIDWDGYFARTHSKVWEFFGLAEDDFTKAYAARDVNTLDFCENKATIMCRQLEYILRNKLLLAASSPLHDNPILCINVWPYQLNAEQCNAIAGTVREFFNPAINVTVTTVYSPKSSLQPKDLKGTYTEYILYDLAEWLAEAGMGLSETPIPDIAIIYPATLNTEDISKYKADSKGTTPFDSIRMLTRLAVDLIAVEPSLYSVDPSLLWPADPTP